MARAFEPVYAEAGGWPGWLHAITLVTGLVCATAWLLPRTWVDANTRRAALVYQNVEWMKVAVAKRGAQERARPMNGKPGHAWPETIERQLLHSVRQSRQLAVEGDAGGIEAAGLLNALGARDFNGKILVMGPADSVMVAAVQELGRRLGMEMLPPLATPFDGASLRNSVETLLQIEAPPNPVIDAAEAMSAGWIELWYQPKFNTRTLQLCGAEALIRVRHPTWGVVPPAYFIPDKNDPYLGVLSNFVIGRAIEDWRSFIAEHRNIEIAVNLPFSFFQHPESIANLCRQMPDHPAFEGLIVEIDAAEVISDPGLALGSRQRFGPVARAVTEQQLRVARVDELGRERRETVG